MSGSALAPRPDAPPAAPGAAVGALDCSIVIVSWNVRDLLRDCLRSIRAGRGRLAVEVHVVDNGSSDGSAAMVADEFPEVDLVENRENRGFAAANNQALARARGRYVLLLNPDTVLAGDVLEATIRYADAHPDAGVVGCEVWRSAEERQRTCFRDPSPLNTLLFALGLTGRFERHPLLGRAVYGGWDRTTARDVDVVSGMFMLVRADALAEVGAMDERYFVYAEEADWCRRFRDAGWRCVFAPVGRILHVDGGAKSTGQVSVRMYLQLQKSLLIYHRTHCGRLGWTAAKLLFVVSMALRAAVWSAVARLGRDRPGARHRARQSRAALRWHLGMGGADRP